MSTLDKIFAIAKALNKGESLRDVETWKTRQGLMIPLSVILALIPQFLPIEVSDADINSMSYGLSIFFSLFATYLVPATSEKVGLPRKGKSNKQ